MFVEWTVKEMKMFKPDLEKGTLLGYIVAIICKNDCLIFSVVPAYLTGSTFFLNLEHYFSVKLSDNMNASSFKSLDKVSCLF